MKSKIKNNFNVFWPKKHEVYKSKNSDQCFITNVKWDPRRAHENPGANLQSEKRVDQIHHFRAKYFHNFGI